MSPELPLRPVIISGGEGMNLQINLWMITFQQMTILLRAARTTAAADQADLGDETVRTPPGGHNRMPVARGRREVVKALWVCLP